MSAAFGAGDMAASANNAGGGAAAANVSGVLGNTISLDEILRATKTNVRKTMTIQYNTIQYIKSCPASPVDEVNIKILAFLVNMCTKLIFGMCRYLELGALNIPALGATASHTTKTMSRLNHSLYERRCAHLFSTCVSMNFEGHVGKDGCGYFFSSPRYFPPEMVDSLVYLPFSRHFSLSCGVLP